MVLKLKNIPNFIEFQPENNYDKNSIFLNYLDRKISNFYSENVKCKNNFHEFSLI